MNRRSLRDFKGPSSAFACAAMVASCALSVVAAGAAQEWAGTGRAQGLVVDAGGKPVTNATVTLRPRAGETGPEAVTTDAKGRWAILGLAPGVWRLTISAEGFLVTAGALRVEGEGPAPLTRTELRPLEEVAAGGDPGNPQTVRVWLEQGNAWLAQGKTAEARIEYERALAALPPATAASVLRAIARTHYLEGSVDLAIAALRRGLAVDPADAESAQLLAALLRQQGKSEEAERILAGGEALAAGAGVAAPPSASESANPEGLGYLRAEPTSHQRGKLTVTLPERSPESDFARLFPRTGIERDKVLASYPDGGQYDLRQESYSLFVPESYRAETPFGLLVWISPGEFGGTARPEIQALLEKHRLIWVGADHSGNDRPRWIRYGLALDAVHNLRRLYTIDEQRIYIGGYSGGGRMSSVLAVAYPETFAGGLYLFGCDYFRELPVPDKPGYTWPASYPRPARKSLERAKEVSRFVFLTGELDFNRPQTRDTWRAYERDDFRNLLYLEIPAVGHYGPVEASWWERALEFLDPERA